MSPVELVVGVALGGEAGLVGGVGAHLLDLLAGVDGVADRLRQLQPRSGR